VIGTISNTVKHGLESFRQKEIRLDKLTELEWQDTANYFPERDMRYGTAELKICPVFKPQIAPNADTASPTTPGEHLQTHDIV
jgi:hypothetical protein